MKELLLTLFLSFALMSLASAQEVTAKSSGQHEKSAGFDPKRDAVKDIRDGVAKAKQEGKRVLLDVGGEWCPWCHKLENFFEANKDASEYRDKYYVVVKVNWSQENPNEAALSKYPKVTGFPHLFVLDDHGKLLQSENTGLLESGDHHDHDKVMAFLKKWSK